MVITHFKVIQGH